MNTDKTTQILRALAALRLRLLGATFLMPLLVGAMVVTVASVASGAALTWDASGTHASSPTDGAGTWSTGTANWSNGSIDSVWSSGNNAIFGNANGAAGTVAVSTVSVGNITFNPPGSGSYTLSGGTITLTSGTITTNAASATIGSTLAGSAGLTTSGTGTLSLTSVNSFTGGTTVNGGTLSLGAAGLSGIINGALTINSGGTVNTSNAWGLGYGSGSCVSSITINGGSLIFSGGGDQGGTSTSSITMTSGTISQTGGTTWDWYNGITNTPTLTTNASASAAVISAAMNLRLGSNSNALTFNVAKGSGPTDLLVSGVISNNLNGGAGSIIKTGSGTMVLTAANTYSGSSSVNQGTLKLDFSASGAPSSNILSTSSALIMGGGTLLVNGGSSGANVQQDSGLTVNVGASSIQLVTNATPQNLKLSLGAITRNIGGAVDFTQPSGTLGSTNGILTTTGTASTILTSSGVAYATVGGNDWAAKDSSNTYIVGLSSIAGGYTASTSTSLSGNADVGSGVTSTTLSSGVTLTSLRFNQAQATTINTGTNIVTTGGILVTAAVGSNVSTITTGTLEGASGKDLLILENDPTGSLSIGSVIADNTSATGLSKAGPGTLTLNGVNTYTGNTTLCAGQININNANALGASTSTFVIEGGTIDNTSSSSITTANYAQTWNGNFTFAGSNPLSLGSGSVALGASNVTVTVNGSGANILTVGGVISGAGSLTVAGNGTLSLTNANTYSGGTIVNSGTLALPTGASAGAIRGLLTINSSGVVNAPTNWALGYNGDSTTVTAITINGGDLNFTGAANSGGMSASSVTMTGGTISGTAFDWYHGGSSGFYTLTTNASATPAVISSGLNLRVGTAGSVTFNVAQGSGAVDLLVSGNIGNGTGGNNGGNIVKAGAGVMELTANNTYTGSTTINAGTLQIGNGGTMGSISSTSGVSGSAGATLAFDRSDTWTPTYSIGGGINVTQAGSGTLTLSGNNLTYTGATTASAGTLIVTGSISGNVAANGGTLIADNAVGGNGSATNSGTLLVGATGILSGSASVAGGTLGGGGTILGNVTVGTGSGGASSSIIYPSAGGGAAGTGLYLSQNLTLNSDAAYQFKLNADQAGNTDYLNVTGTLTIATGATLTGFNVGSGTSSGDIHNMFVIAYAGNIVGTFANAPATGDSLLIGIDTYTIDYSSTEIELELTAVPEPGTWATVLGGLGLLCVYQRRRRVKAE